MASIRARDVAVEFPVYRGASRSLKKSLLAASTQGNLAKDALDRVNVVALKDVTLDIEEGERIGIMGANGAGKTTLLKVLAGIYEPTRGRVRAEGRMTALLATSLGLDTDATGRENIVLRGLFMGIHPREMRGRIREIAEFTELGPYLDLPVRTYSSGMMLRLAFAITTSVRPAILLMDEMISAGDAGFIEKARARVRELISNANIFVISSHVQSVIQEFCNRVLWLEHGKVVMDGKPDEVLAAYTAAGAT